MLRKLRAAYQPDYIAAVFESGPSFREQEFASTSTAPRCPTTCASRSPDSPPSRRHERARSRIRGLKRRRDRRAGRKAEPDVDVVIVSSDKDMLQLVDHRVPCTTR